MEEEVGAAPQVAVRACSRAEQEAECCSQNQKWDITFQA